MYRQVFILDNGAYTIKAGSSDLRKPTFVPNSIFKAKRERQSFIGSQINNCQDKAGLFYVLPVKRGIISDWDTQKTIWDYLFSKECCPIKMSTTRICFTEPYNNFTSIRESVAEIFYEEYHCKSLLELNPGDLSAYHYNEAYRPDKKVNKMKCCVVVDSGYSHTHVVPYVFGKKYRKAVKRIDIGGKILTNSLKDMISYRQLNVMEETYAINQVKEDCCFVSQDLTVDLKRPKQSHLGVALEYVLPDYSKTNRGYVRDPKHPPVRDSQRVILRNERFAVPELLFHPNDIGINQMGLAEAICYCIGICPKLFHKELWGNIILTGGSTLFPGFQTRLITDLKDLVPSTTRVNVSLPENPISYAWEGGAIMRMDPYLYSWFVTRRDYEEYGMELCRRRFNRF